MIYEQMFDRTLTTVFKEEVLTPLGLIVCTITNSSPDYGGSPDVDKIVITLNKDDKSIVLFSHSEVDYDYDIEKVKKFLVKLSWFIELLDDNFNKLY